MGGDGVDLEAITEGLWLRIRDVILAERRFERFAFRPDAPEGSVPERLASLVGDAVPTAPAWGLTSWGRGPRSGGAGAEGVPA